MRTALGEPITYTALTITDGKLGSWEFHNARVYLTLESDSSHAQTFTPYPTTDVVVSINSFGKAYITVTTPEKTVRARFDDGQIFVAVDRGRLALQPYTGGRGIGFGSFPPGGGFEPAYPLGIEDGTIDWGDAAEDSPPNNPSPELASLSLDLTRPTAFSGRGFVCVGFPDRTCPAPGYALKTNLGDLYLYQPYSDHFDVLTGGIFTAAASNDHEDGSAPGRAYPVGQRSMTDDGEHEHPITYHGTLVSDVKVGGHYFSHALIELSFDADTSTAHPYTDGSSSGTVNEVGHARFRVSSGPHKLEGTFAKGQIYVFFDSANVSVGFGSKLGGRGYPLALTHHEDFDGLVEFSLMTAVWNFLYTPGSAAFYTPETATLVTWSGGAPGSGTASYSLTTPTLLSGGASSCVAFDASTSNCSNLNPLPLQTSAGNFELFEPYTAGNTYTINWGLFWAEFPSHRDD
ncbi:MAG: hypothetical protein JO299_15310 [Gammaproteobacteria bacterium]|nr:hypothetical protein [Gammaproteobacteria bacterium]